MKSIYLLPTALVAALFVASCNNDNAILPTGAEENSNTVTFTLHTPSGENVIYGRAIHDEAEYAINTLALYEYEVTAEGTSLSRIMKKDGNGTNSLDMIKNADNSYTFSIIVPAENNGRQYSYKFIANDPTEDPAAGSSFDDFKGTLAKTIIDKDDYTADVLSTFSTDEEGTTTYGIAMSGVAKTDDGSEIITMSKGIKCEVALTRIVSRIDISYQTPNLQVTNVYLTGAPATGLLFPGEEASTPAEGASFRLAKNSNVDLPATFLQASEGYTKGMAFEMKKAFYVYERANTADDCMSVHIDYNVAANGREDYEGSVDVPFSKLNEAGETEYVDAKRNNLYRIVLGNGTDPITGKVTVKIIVNEWNGTEIDEPLTDDDPIKE